MRQSRFPLLCCACLLASIGVGAEQTGAIASLQPPILHDVDFTGFDASAKPQRLQLQLEKAGSAGPLIMHIWVRGGEIGNGWAIDPAQAWNPQVLQTNASGLWGLPAQLTLSADGSLSGRVFRGSQHLYLIDGKVSGNSVRGSWTRERYEASKGFPKKLIDSETGSFTGQLHEVGALAAASKNFPDEATIHGWRNNGDGVGYETGVSLIEHPSQARVLWKSEDFVPQPYSEGNNLGAPIVKIQGGHASPIAAEGLVFQYYYVGSGSTWEKEKARVEQALDQIANGDKKGNKPPPFPDAIVKKKFSDNADQVMVAIDSATGATVWKQVFKDDGPNLSAHGRTGLMGPDSKSPSHLTPCYGDGAVFFQSTASCIYALEAKTGKLRWRHGSYEASTMRGDSWHTGGTHALAFVDGVVVGKGIGLEAKTGKVLWEIDRQALFGILPGRGATLVRWHASKRTLLLSMGGHCLDPKTGEVLWSVPLADEMKKALAANDKHIVYTGEGGMTVYRVADPARAPEHVGTFTTASFPRNVWPVLYRDHLYARGGRWQGSPDSTVSTVGNSDWRTFCIDPTNGSILGEAFGSKSYASVTAGDGWIFSCSAVSVIAQDPDPKNFRDLHDVTSEGLPLGPADHMSPRTFFIGSPETTAIYVAGRLICRQFDGIVCYDLRRTAN